MEENNKQPTPTPSNKVVETYAEDMAEVIKSDQGGLIKKIIHEEESREEEKIMQSPETKRNKLFALLGSFLVLVSILIVGFFLLNDTVSTVRVEKSFNSIIFNDETAFIDVTDLSKAQITQSIRREVETKDVKLGGVDGIYLMLDKSIIGLRKFNELIKSSFSLEGNDFVDDNFLLGFVNNGDELGRDFFILIQMRSFTDIFENMRAWENKMFNDLHGLFGIVLSAETAPLLTENFENGIVQNKNARILYQADAEGGERIAMMYVFVDDTHLLITESESAVREVITRLLGNNLRD